MKRHVISLLVAIGVLCAIWTLAIYLNLARVDIASWNLGALMIGVVAAGLSLPPVGALVLLSSRRGFRRAWRNTDSAARRLVAVYLCSDIVAAGISWTAFVLALKR